MAYRRFKLAELSSPPATLATFATVHPVIIETVASVANVAEPKPKTALRVMPAIDPYAGWGDEDWHTAFAEWRALCAYAAD
jgi:hypothetical protein